MVTFNSWILLAMFLAVTIPIGLSKVNRSIKLTYISILCLALPFFMIRGELKTRSSFTKKDFGFSSIDSESLLNENSYLATQNNLSAILDQNRFKDFNDWENWVTEKDRVFNLAEFGAPLKSTVIFFNYPDISWCLRLGLG